MLADLAECTGLCVSDSRHVCSLLQILCCVLSGSEMRSGFYLCESPGKEFPSAMGHSARLRLGKKCGQQFGCPALERKGA